MTNDKTIKNIYFEGYSGGNSFYFSEGNIEEGAVIDFRGNTTGFNTGDFIYWSIDKNQVTKYDFNGGIYQYSTSAGVGNVPDVNIVVDKDADGYVSSGKIKILAGGGLSYRGFGRYTSGNTLQVINDNITEGSETFYINFYSDENRTNLVDKSGSITISDTSLGDSSDNINPIIDGPNKTSGRGQTSSNVSVSENNILVHKFTSNESVVWSVSGGDDSSLFSFVGNDGTLTFRKTNDYENPLDSDQNNIYNVTVKAKDTYGNSSTQSVKITVNDVVDEGSENSSNDNNSPDELVSGSELKMLVGQTDLLTGIKDYDGNLHGFLGSAPSSVKSSYKYQGKLDVNADGITEAIYTNEISGRWVTASIDLITGGFNYGKHGQGNSTRIVGIYEDPLVKAGLVEKDSDLDGSRTFINDLKLDNLILKTVGDYDNDGYQEIYWSKVDNTAYLRAVMWEDGNIQYANYQNLDQMTNYLTSHGFADTVALIA